MILTLAEIAWWSLVVAFSGALMPGPVLAVTIAGTREKGFWFGPLVIVGHALVEAPLVLLLVAGLDRALDNPWIVVGIASVGSAAMVWMGVGLLRQARRPGAAGKSAGFLRLGAVGSGALTSAMNPYWYVWWVTAGAALLVSARAAGWLGVGVFFVAHISADFIWYTLVALGVVSGRRLLEGRGYKVLLAVCGVVVLGIAARFAWMAQGMLRAELAP